MDELLTMAEKIQSIPWLTLDTTTHNDDGESVGVNDVKGGTAGARRVSPYGTVINAVRTATCAYYNGHSTEPGHCSSVTP